MFVCLFYVLWIRLKKKGKAFAVVTSMVKRKRMWVEVVSDEIKVYWGGGLDDGCEKRPFAHYLHTQWLFPYNARFRPIYEGMKNVISQGQLIILKEL